MVHLDYHNYTSSYDNYGCNGTMKNQCRPCKQSTISRLRCYNRSRIVYINILVYSAAGDFFKYRRRYNVILNTSYLHWF